MATNTIHSNRRGSQQPSKPEPMRFGLSSGHRLSSPPPSGSNLQTTSPSPSQQPANRLRPEHQEWLGSSPPRASASEIAQTVFEGGQQVRYPSPGTVARMQEVLLRRRQRQEHTTAPRPSVSSSTTNVVASTAHVSPRGTTPKRTEEEVRFDLLGITPSPIARRAGGGGGLIHYSGEMTGEAEMLQATSPPSFTSFNNNSTAVDAAVHTTPPRRQSITACDAEPAHSPSSYSDIMEEHAPRSLCASPREEERGHHHHRGIDDGGSGGTLGGFESSWLQTRTPVPAAPSPIHRRRVNSDDGKEKTQTTGIIIEEGHQRFSPPRVYSPADRDDVTKHPQHSQHIRTPTIRLQQDNFDEVAKSSAMPIMSHIPLTATSDSNPAPADRHYLSPASATQHKRIGQMAPLSSSLVANSATHNTADVGVNTSLLVHSPSGSSPKHVLSDEGKERSYAAAGGGREGLVETPRCSPPAPDPHVFIPPPPYVPLISTHTKMNDKAQLPLSTLTASSAQYMDALDRATEVLLATAVSLDFAMRRNRAVMMSAASGAAVGAAEDGPRRREASTTTSSAHVPSPSPIAPHDHSYHDSAWLSPPPPGLTAGGGDDHSVSVEEDGFIVNGRLDATPRLHPNPAASGSPRFGPTPRLSGGGGGPSRTLLHDGKDLICCDGPAAVAAAADDRDRAAISSSRIKSTAATAFQRSPSQAVCIPRAAENRSISPLLCNVSPKEVSDEVERHGMSEGTHGSSVGPNRFQRRFISTSSTTALTTATQRRGSGSPQTMERIVVAPPPRCPLLDEERCPPSIPHMLSSNHQAMQQRH